MARVWASTPWTGVDDEERAFAGGEGAGDFVGEVDVAGGVDEVELVGFAVVGLVHHADGVGLDGDAALALEVHGVEDLGLHLARGEGAGELEEPIGEGGLAVVDVRDDREVADVAWIHFVAGGLSIHVNTAWGRGFERRRRSGWVLVLPPPPLICAKYSK